MRRSPHQPISDAIRRFIFITLGLIALAPLTFRPVRAWVWRLVTRNSTVEDRLQECGAAEARLRARFDAHTLAYPPSSVTLVAIKDRRELRLLVPVHRDWREVARYPILAASGVAGPKLRQGDRQVPEGFYGIESLNPNSLYHLALRMSYPNDEDRRHASDEGRTNLGGDIMIHGKAASIGCLAMGDPAIEELFVLAARVGVEHVDVVLAPSLTPDREAPAVPWGQDLYRRLAARLEELGVKE